MSQRSPFQTSMSTAMSPGARSRPADVTRALSTTWSPSSTASTTRSTSPYSRMTSSPTGTGASGASPTGAVEYPKTGMRAGPIGPSKPGVANPLKLIKVEQNPLAEQAKQTAKMLEKQNALKKELREEVVQEYDSNNWESSLSSWKNRRRSSASYTPKVLDLVVDPDADFLSATTTSTSTADRRNGKTFQQLVDEKKERTEGDTNSSYMYDDEPQSPVFQEEDEQRKNSSHSSSKFQTETRHQTSAERPIKPTTMEKSHRAPPTGSVASAVDKYDRHEEAPVRQRAVEVRSTSTRVAAAAAAAGDDGDVIVDDVVHRSYKYSEEGGKGGKMSPSVERLEDHRGIGTGVNVEMRTTATLPSATRFNHHQPGVNATEYLMPTSRSSKTNVAIFPAPRYPYSPDLNDNTIKSDHHDRDSSGSRTVTDVTEFRNGTEVLPPPRVALSSTEKKMEIRHNSDDNGLITADENIPPRQTVTSSIRVSLKQNGEASAAGDNSNRSASTSAQGLLKQGGANEVTRQEQHTTCIIQKHVSTTGRPEVHDNIGDVQFRSDHRGRNNDLTKTAKLEEPDLAPMKTSPEAADDEPPPLPSVPPPELDWDTYPTSAATVARHSDDDDDDDDKPQIQGQCQGQGHGHSAQSGLGEDGSTRENMNRRRDEFFGLRVEKF